MRVDLWFVLSLRIRVWWEASGGWAEFFNHGWTRMNTDVLRGIESQDLCVLICGLCFRLEFAFGGQRAAGGLSFSTTDGHR